MSKKKKFVGILTIDFPELTDTQQRGIQLGTLTKLPDGTTVAAYRAQIEANKAEAIEAESKQRAKDLASLAVETAETPTEEKEKDTETEEADAETEDLDNLFDEEFEEFTDETVVAGDDA